MGTIADKLQKLLSTKEAIKQAIISKGVSISDTDTFFSYASKIKQIEAGGGTGGSEDWEITDCSHLFRDAARLDIFDEIAAHIKKPTSFYYAFYQNSSNSNYRIIDMSKLGDTSAVTSCAYMFGNCAYIQEINNFGDLSSCTDAERMFYGCSWLNKIDLSNVNFAALRDASNMFYNCKALTKIDLTLPTLDNATYMFYSCSTLTDVNLKGILGSGTVTNMSFMFYQCSDITELDFAECNTSNVQTVSSSFARMSELISLLNLDLSGVTSTSYLNFFGSYTANNVKNITFKQGTVFGKSTQASEIILNLTRATAFNVDGYVNMINSLGTNTTGYTRTIKLYTELYNSLTDEQKALATDKGYNLSYGTS